MLRCVVSGLLLMLVMVGTAAARQPNVILIMCDDMGYEGVSAYGSPDYKTPVLDKLAAEGMLFNHCYSQPICTPSRVQIMTGKYNLRNYTKFGQLRTSETTFGNLMRSAGYETAIAGKWQLGGDSKTVDKFGFDEHCLWHLDGRASRFWNPRLVTNGKLMEGLEKKFGPDVVADFVTDFIDRKKDKPFFIYYPMMLVHWPFVPTPDSPPGGSRERSGKYDGQNGGVEYFDDMVAYMDKIIGRVVDKLDEHKLREDTLIMFTGDNGCATNIRSRMGDRTIAGGKGSLPDAGTHVALVANWKGHVPAGKVSNTLVDFTDMLPTLLDMAGASVPQSAKIDGQSFLPQLKGEEGNPRQWVFCHYIRNGVPADPGTDAKRMKLAQKQQQARKKKQLGRFARDQKFKLYDDGRFYNVATDVEEKYDLNQGRLSPEAAAARRKLQAVHDSMPAWKTHK